MMSSPENKQLSKQETAQRRDVLLLKLLKTPPQPRPKRERPKKSKPKRKPKKQTPAE